VNYLITEQPVTHNAGLNYTGQDAVDHVFKDHPELQWHSQVLHCEFEGDGIYVLFLTAQAALFSAFLAFVVCVVIPALGWLVALLESVADSPGNRRMPTGRHCMMSLPDFGNAYLPFGPPHLRFCHLLKRFDEP
jgi:hypothetical protein